jgi:hypothetical protein
VAAADPLLLLLATGEEEEEEELAVPRQKWDTEGQPQLQVMYKIDS